MTTVNGIYAFFGIYFLGSIHNTLLQHGQHCHQFERRTRIALFAHSVIQFLGIAALSYLPQVDHGFERTGFNVHYRYTTAFGAPFQKMLFQCFVSYVLKAGIYRKHQILAVHRVFFVSVGQRFPLVPYLLHHPRSGTPLEQRHVVPFGTHISLVVVGIPDKTPRQIT